MGWVGLSDCVTLSQRVPRQAGVPCSGLSVRPASTRPSPLPRRHPGSSPFVRLSLFWHRGPQVPSTKAEPGYSRLPGAEYWTPWELGAPALRIWHPQPPWLPALLPVCAPGAKPATREQSTARGAEWRARRSGAGTPDCGAARARAPATRPWTPGPCLPRDPAPAPGSGRRRCSCSACQGSPCGRRVSVWGVPARRRARGGAWVLSGESEARRGCPLGRARNTISLGGNKERSCPATPPPSCSSPSPRAPKRPHRAPEPLLNAQEKACALVLQAHL